MKQTKLSEWFDVAKELLAERYKETFLDEDKGAFLVLKQDKEIVDKLMREHFLEDETLFVLLISRAPYEADEINSNDAFLTLRFHNDDGRSIEIDFSSYFNGMGYCFCEPKDEGFNEAYHCCGVACDWSVPSLTVTKKDVLKYDEFNGKAKDIWNFDFSEEYKEIKRKKEAEARKQSLEHKKSQVEVLLEQISELEKKIEEEAD